MNKIKKLYCDHLTVSVVITVVVLMALLHYLRMLPVAYEISFIISDFVVAVIVTALIYLINGEGELLFSTKGLGYVFKLAWWPLLITCGAPIVLIVISLLGGRTVAGNPFLITLGAVVLAVFVGYFEEGLFRGIVLNAFLRKLGGNFKGVLMACIYSSIIFGFLHVYSDFFAFFTNPSTFSFGALAQVIGKTISAGLFGFVLAVVILRNHNLFSVALAHGINDFGAFLMTFLFNEQGLSHYVNTGSSAQNSFISYGYIGEAIIMLPVLIYAYRQLKKVSIPQNGFFEEPWYPKFVK